MWAVLQINTQTLLLDGNGDEWNETTTVDIVNPRHPYYTKEIPNPAPPVIQVQHHTYTNSEFTQALDDAIVRKYKGVKKQKIMDAGGNCEEVWHDEIWESIQKITSINQIHLAGKHPDRNTALDDIFIPLPMMLDWIVEEGWEIQQTMPKTVYFKSVPYM